MSGAERQRNYRARLKGRRPSARAGAVAAPDVAGDGEAGLQLLVQLSRRSLQAAVDGSAVLPPDVAAKVMIDYHRLQGSRGRRAAPAPKPAPENAR